MRGEYDDPAGRRSELDPDYFFLLCFSCSSSRSFATSMSPHIVPRVSLVPRATCIEPDGVFSSTGEIHTQTPSETRRKCFIRVSMSGFI